MVTTWLTRAGKVSRRRLSSVDERETAAGLSRLHRSGVAPAQPFARPRPEVKRNNTAVKIFRLHVLAGKGAFLCGEKPCAINGASYNLF
jgi:hypothetical protein